MAPPGGPLLKKEEEGWREALERLRERFPTLAPERVVQALRNSDGHAGSAAAELRALTSTNVKPPDPDDAEHVATLLSSPVMFKHACKEQFKKFDANGDGVLDVREVVSLTNELYHSFGLQQPSEECLKAFFNATDENGDGVLSEREFRRFFEMFLRYAFFDVVKLQQLVNKNSGKAPAIDISMPLKLQDQDDDEEPQQVRPALAAPAPALAPAPTPAPPPQVQQQPGPERERSGGGFAQAPVPDDRRRSRRSSEGQSYGGREGGRGGDGGRSGPNSAYVCVVDRVTVRNSAEWSDRSNQVVSQGEAVQVLEHWIRTPAGWLPVEDPHGAPLFERARHRGDGRERQRNSDDNQRVSEVKGDRPQRREREPKSSTADPGASLPEEYKQVFERLKERFPSASADQVVHALKSNDGHAGKAASVLRDLAG